MSDIQVGVRILCYAERIAPIANAVADAAEQAHKAAAGFAGETGGDYDGGARGEMKLFYESWAANADKLGVLLSISAQFLGRVVTEFTAADDDLDAVVLAWLEGSW